MCRHIRQRSPITPSVEMFEISNVGYQVHTWKSVDDATVSLKKIEIGIGLIRTVAQVERIVTRTLCIKFWSV